MPKPPERIDERADTRHNQLRRLRREENRSSWSYNLGQYLEAIQEGPTIVCCSCGGLFYKKSIRSITFGEICNKGWKLEDIPEICRPPDVSDDSQLSACETCRRTISAGKIPKLALKNGFKYPDLPTEVTQLTNLEERLVSLRIPFMQVRCLGRDRQYGLKGNVVNVSNDFQISVDTLPRNLEDTDTIQVMLMRRMCYKVPYLHETIRPKKVYDAAKYLVTTPAYVEAGITLSPVWFTNLPGIVEQNTEVS